MLQYYNQLEVVFAYLSTYNKYFLVTINPQAVIGNNCNIHKGVTIGQENRGKGRGYLILEIVYG